MHSALVKMADFTSSVILFLVDHTRVVLNDGDMNEPGSDYINANIIMVITTWCTDESKEVVI